MTTFDWPIRVYYEDTDAGGVVYHSQYLNFCERARTEWLRSLQFEQTWLKNTLDVIFVVRDLSIDYKKPARFDDQLIVSSQVSKLGHASLIFTQNIYCHSELIVSLNVKVASVSASTFNPVAIPIIVKEKLAEFVCQQRDF